jgi:sugar lactone lactonase YvrE
LVELFLAHKLVNIGQKNELELVVEHWQAKKLATIQTRTNLLVMAKKIGSLWFGSNTNTATSSKDM